MKSLPELMKEWRIRLRPDSTEGYCWQSRRILDVGLANENPLRLLLHEIAHIDNDPHGNKHNQEWLDTYLALMTRYMPGVDVSESDKIIIRTYKLDMKGWTP